MTDELIGYPGDAGGDFPAVYWKSWDVDATFLPGGVLPEESQGLLWAVLAIVYYGDKVVLADIEGRGFCIPSDKTEDGETIDQALEREVYEETGARLDPRQRRLIGCYRLESRKTRPSSQPRLRYCPVFIAEARGFEAIPAGSESRGLFLAQVEDLADLYYTWDDLMAAVFDHAERLRHTLLPSGTPLSELMNPES
jgi:8-oxo-dGTP diphosphatase